MRHFHREYHEAVALVSWFAHEANRRGIDQRLLIHINNETGGIGAKRGWFNKQIGVRAGVCDFCLFIPAQGYHGLMIELKAPSKTARLSPAQEEMMKILSGQGYVAVVAWGWDDAKNRILGYLGAAK